MLRCPLVLAAGWADGLSLFCLFVPNLLIVWMPFDRYIQGAEHVRTVCMGAYGWGGLVFLLVKSQGKESLAILAQVRGVYSRLVLFCMRLNTICWVGWRGRLLPLSACWLCAC